MDWPTSLTASKVEVPGRASGTDCQGDAFSAHSGLPHYTYFKFANTIALASIHGVMYFWCHAIGDSVERGKKITKA